MKHIRNMYSLNELRVIDNNELLKEDEYTFILFQKNLYIFDEESYEEIFDKLNDDFDGNLEGDYDDDIEMIKEEYPYVLQGTVDNGYIYLNFINFRHDLSSPDFKKLRKELGDLPVRITTYGKDYSDDEEFDEYNPSDKFYHGTTVEYLSHILKSGLMPKADNTNFDKIEHADKVFVTKNYEKAYYHALTAAEKTNDFPVIIQIKIPDPSKLIVDYDIAIDIYGPDDIKTAEYNYDEVFYNTGSMNKTKDEFYKEKYKDRDPSKKLGVYGYLGRIPATFIEKIVLDDEAYRTYIIGDYSYEETQLEEIGMWSELKPSNLKDIREEVMEEDDDEIEEDDD